MSDGAIVSASTTSLRVRVFVDYWNFQLALNEREAERRGAPDYRFRVAWFKVGP